MWILDPMDVFLISAPSWAQMAEAHILHHAGQHQRNSGGLVGERGGQHFREQPSTITGMLQTIGYLLIEAHAALFRCLLQIASQAFA